LSFEEYVEGDQEIRVINAMAMAKVIHKSVLGDRIKKYSKQADIILALVQHPRTERSNQGFTYIEDHGDQRTP
jgi:TnpA family transposase